MASSSDFSTWFSRGSAIHCICQKGPSIIVQLLREISLVWRAQSSFLYCMLSEITMIYYLIFLPSSGFTDMELWEVWNKRQCYDILFFWKSYVFWGFFPFYLFIFFLKNFMKCVSQSLEHSICVVFSKVDDIKLSFPKSSKYIPREHLVRSFLK